MKILDRFGMPAKKGEVGIEVEMEGEGLGPDTSQTWSIHHDGSLRGQSIEYVLTQPCPRNEIRTVLNGLLEVFKKNNSKLNPSDRCGVHIHLNMQNVHESYVTRVIALYLILEDLFVHWCGEERVGNLFCLRANDASYFLSRMAQVMEDDDTTVLEDEALRYASINPCALARHGSLEFRAMQTPKDILEIEKWVKMLLQVKDSAKLFDSLPNIVEQFSYLEPEGFLHKVMGEYAKELQHLGMHQMMFDGMRNVQDFAYIKPLKKKKKVQSPRYNDEDHPIDQFLAEQPRYRPQLGEVIRAPRRG